MGGHLGFSFLPPHASSTRVRSLAVSTQPRLAPAAVRVPHDDTDLVIFPSGRPQLFVHEGARQALERRLQMAASMPVVLSITDNRHSMVRHVVRQGIMRVRAHHMFLDAPADIQTALVRYVLQADRQASHLVGRFISANLHRLRPQRRSLTRLSPRGTHHDLLAIYHKLNDTYFGGTVDALITWGRSPGRPRFGARKSIKLGSYNALERIISVHPVLDRAWVPRYFVAFVVYHEMLHHLVPPVRSAGRTLAHPSRFRRFERLFRDYERALVWEKAHIGRLLRAR